MPEHKNRVPKDIDPAIQAQAQALYQRTKALFNGAELNQKNVFHFLQLSMEVVELNTDLSGAQKKGLVVAALKLAADDMVPDDAEYQVLNHFIDYFIDAAIDSIVEVNGNKLQVNVKKSPIYTCLNSCGNLFKRCRSGEESPAPAPAPVSVPSVPSVPTPEPVSVPAPEPVPVEKVSTKTTRSVVEYDSDDGTWKNDLPDPLDTKNR